MARRAYIKKTRAGLLNERKFTDLLIRVAGHYVRAMGHQARRASVPDYQVAYCVEGRGEIECGGRVQQVGAGDVFVNIPGHGHRYGADPADPWTLWWVHFKGGAAARYFELLGVRPSRSVVPVGRNERLVGLFRDLIRELECPEQSHQLMAVAHLHMILSFLIALQRQQLTVRRRIRTRTRLDMKRLNAFIDRRIKDLCLGDLARAARVSVPHLERLFKDQTGYAPFEYVIQRRVARASEMLLTRPSLPIKEVAARIGYRDERYFSRLFKKIVGMPPGRFRRMYR